LPPSPFEVCFLSTAHDESHVQRTVDAWEIALQTVAKQSATP